MMLTEDQVRELTGYRQHARQHRWLVEKLKIDAPLRADGLPIVTQLQIEAAVAGTKAPANGPKWTRSA
jgi:hypothetical protein